MSVIIKDLRNEDAAKIAHWKSDHILSNQILSNFKKTDEKEVSDWIDKNTSDINQYLQGIHCVDGSAESLIGIVRLMYIDLESQTAELGIYIGDQSNQNKGSGGSALELMLKKAFSDFNLEKIYLKVASFNERAIALYLKRKFKIEGTLRQHCCFDDSYYDVICMALFKDEFV